MIHAWLAVFVINFLLHIFRIFRDISSTLDDLWRSDHSRSSVMLPFDISHVTSFSILWYLCAHLYPFRDVARSCWKIVLASVCARWERTRWFMRMLELSHISTESRLWQTDGQTDRITIRVYTVLCISFFSPIMRRIRCFGVTVGYDAATFAGQ